LNRVERVLRALSLEEPDTVPYTELLISSPIIASLSTTTGVDALIESHERLDMDMITVSETRLDQLDTQGVRGDDWGVTYIERDGVGWYVTGSFTQPEDVVKFKPPDPFTDGRMHGVEEVLHRVKGRIAVAGNVPGEKLTYLTRGFTGFFSDIYRRPDVAQHLVDMVTDYNVGLCKQMVELGVDLIVVTGDIAEKTGPMMSPAAYRRFFYPCLKAIVDEAHWGGVPVVKHSDGNLYPILKDVVDTGIDGLHSIEPLAGMDIAEVKKMYGDRLCLLGNIDCSQTLCIKDVEDVKREVAECIEAASYGGGHIVCSSNSYHPGVRLSNILAFKEAARKYGKYRL